MNAKLKYIISAIERPKIGSNNLINADAILFTPFLRIPLRSIFEQKCAPNMPPDIMALAVTSGLRHG